MVEDKSSGKAWVAALMGSTSDHYTLIYGPIAVFGPFLSVSMKRSATFGSMH